MSRSPRFYYVTLPIASVAFGVGWYLPFEHERQREKKKSLYELWQPWLQETMAALRSSS